MTRDPLQPWLPFTSDPTELADETFISEMWLRGYRPIDLHGSDLIAWVLREEPAAPIAEPDDLYPETEQPPDED